MLEPSTPVLFTANVLTELDQIIAKVAIGNNFKRVAKHAPPKFAMQHRASAVFYANKRIFKQIIK